MSRLLDTNICIYVITRKPLEVVQRFTQYIPGEIAISSIAVAELRYGAEKSQFPERNRQAIEQFLLPLIVLPFDGAAAEAYGRIRATLERQGRPIGPLDLLIAAHALSLDLTLVTNNESEFARVPGLKIENWL